MLLFLLLVQRTRRFVFPANETACGHQSHGRFCAYRPRIDFQPETVSHNSLFDRTFHLTLAGSIFYATILLSA